MLDKMEKWLKVTATKYGAIVCCARGEHQHNHKVVACVRACVRLLISTSFIYYITYY